MELGGGGGGLESTPRDPEKFNNRSKQVEDSCEDVVESAGSGFFNAWRGRTWERERERRREEGYKRG